MVHLWDLITCQPTGSSLGFPRQVAQKGTHIEKCFMFPEHSSRYWQYFSCLG